MNEQRNIFLEHKRTMLEIARANHVDTSVAANLACQMAREALADKPVSYSTEGVEDFMTWAGEVENLTEAEIAAQMAEYNRAASQAIINGKPWTLED
jgi:hypothetical protein